MQGQGQGQGQGRCAGIGSPVLIRDADRPLSTDALWYIEAKYLE